MSELIHIWDTCLSDFYKDAYGVRPRHYKDWWTQEELDKEYDYLSKVCAENAKDDAIREAKALVNFNKIIDETIASGAADRETAIRWLVEAEGLEFTVYDLEYFFWGYGLSYEEQREFASNYAKK